ncbi:aspartate--ammonia ligase [Fusobacterium perfoetens]|uniref:aspartate--ammonia ligase n=1 Tax=Fusobacterium perfoetens TaxID=852 RepID=UPI00048833E9|nr:aspartate--ammonia ligase [Fusobacterium perfoetens]MCI6153349.1 aspartate--ammonia ligase [Fusobacterium perfoetens]MDY3237144.1 aspartate--ammonia ligase [Fusobacterium perfoetens]
MIQNYDCKLDLYETEVAIKKVKDYFERTLAYELNLTRVSAPLYVRRSSGMNDDLNGVERPVIFDTKWDKSEEFQVIHSLAKWKRMALKRYNFPIHTGLYTDMNAIRRDEDLDYIHSMYVDQWDWELIIKKEERTMETLKTIVKDIYKALRKTEEYLIREYPIFSKKLPYDIFFVTSQELEDMYPTLTPKEREDAITREHKAVFISQIGKILKSGEKHDGRAPDYDDWDLNGDILVWNPVLERALEISSMGIRVSEESLESQLKLSGHEERKELPFHKALLNKELPYTIGGGIGQSRICMFFLEKLHIGEVQASVWPDEMIEDFAKLGAHFL